MNRYFRLITFSHTVFALPFALVGCMLGWLQEGYAGWQWKLLAVLGCMVFARSAAMAFNRWLDRDIDALNPRTGSREIPAGVVSEESALRFVIVMVLLFVATTWWINPLCFALSPVAIAVVLGYSYTKRFTALCHVVLGVGLSLAPVGSFLAITGYFDVIPVLLGFSVLMWVAGFDIIYALQDEEFDRANHLFSIPVVFGKRTALRISKGLHLVSSGLLITAMYLVGQRHVHMGWLSQAGLAVFLLMLIYQHTLVKESDLSRVNRAFFTTNGIASVVFGLLFLADALL